MREVIVPTVPSAVNWKASEYRLVGGPLNEAYIEAAPGAVWERRDPFQTYRPAGDRGAGSMPPPHGPFSKLAYMQRKLIWPDGEAKKQFYRAVNVFADCYGLLGLLREGFGMPQLSERRVDWVIRVAPDAVVDGGGKMREIDPATEGKRLLGDLLSERSKQIYEEGNAKYRFRISKVSLEFKRLILPSELRFPTSATDLIGRGESPPFSESNDSPMFTYQDIQRWYGARILLDRRSDTGVSLISTREPVSIWRQELGGFARSPMPTWYLNRNLEDVWPFLVTDEDGRDAGGWYCPSLLKALYLMVYLDRISGTKIQKCQAPGCSEYFRVGPSSRVSLYCPPPPGKKQSKCASRASSAMHRERQRQKSGAN